MITGSILRGQKFNLFRFITRGRSLLSGLPNPCDRPIEKTATNRIQIILPILFLVTFFACTGIPFSSNEDPSAKIGYETYSKIREQLEESGDSMDYYTLMDIYASLVHTTCPVPHMDQLLTSLIYKRNDNPRVDQMILIFSARIIGKSKFPVPNVYEIFDSIINMDDRRVNEWVISFVAAAIGDYAWDIPDGDTLVDQLEQRLDKTQSASTEDRENFGSHFMPPPKSRFIRNYIAGIKGKNIREMERRCYYALITNGLSENDIEVAVKKLQADGIHETGEPCPTPMRYLLLNLNG